MDDATTAQDLVVELSDPVGETNGTCSPKAWNEQNQLQHGVRNAEY